MKSQKKTVQAVWYKGGEVPLHTPNKLPFCVVQIHVYDDEGAATGTGFFFDFEVCGGHVPCLVTNKHVIEGAKSAEIRFHVRSSGKPLTLGDTAAAILNDFERGWVKHPTADLAVFPMAGVDMQVRGDGRDLFYIPLRKSIVVDAAFVARLGPAADVLMVGYPNGVSDEVNNLPVVRKGITATPMFADYNGKPEFLIDCAIYDGSSGSPIFAHVVFEHFDKRKKRYRTRHEIRLIGVLRGSHRFEAPLQSEKAGEGLPERLTVQMMMGLGVCIKADELAWFENALADLVAAKAFEDPAMVVFRGGIRDQPDRDT
jgi:hypothetical protein